MSSRRLRSVLRSQRSKYRWSNASTQLLTMMAFEAQRGRCDAPIPAYHTPLPQMPKNQSLPLVLLAGAGAGAGEGAGEAGAGAGTFAAGVSVAGLASPWLAESTRLRFLSPSFLKSVSYQPLPARRKEGALTRRCSSGSPQLGQIVGSSSDSFCRRSKR
jgi:hypothetical protein